MRRHWLVFLIGLMLSHFLYGQHIYFNNRYDFNQSCDGSNAILVIPEGYLVAVQTDSSCNWGRVGLLKLDSLGNVIWRRKYGIKACAYGVGISSLIFAENENYTLVGYRDSAVMLWNFNKNGDSTWTRVYYDINYNLSGAQCKLTPDSGFIITGTAYSKNTGIYQVLLIKTDSLGKEQWRKVYNSSGNDIGYSIDTCNDHGYIIGSGWNSPELIKTDSFGNIQWQYSYSGYGFAGVTSLRKGGYAFAFNYGSSTSTEEGCNRVDSKGKQVWYKYYSPTGPNTEFSSAPVELKNYDFIISGQITDSNTVNGAILRIDSIGNLLWYGDYKKLKAPNSSNYLRDVKPTIDGGFIASGFVNPAFPDTGTSDVWVLKVDSNGCDSIGHCPLVTSLQQIQEEKEDITLYPNPNNGLFSVSMRNVFEKSEIKIYNVFGQEVCQSQLNSTITSIDLSGHPPGFYLYYVETGNKIVQRGKFIVAR